MIIDWTFLEAALTEDVEVALSAHAIDRALGRSNLPFKYVKKEIEDLIQQAADKIETYANKFQTFIIKGKDHLNVVGTVIKQGSDLIFRVITLMWKKAFIPNNPHDKVISITESLKSGFSAVQLAKKFSISQKEAEKKLSQGTQHEFEHTNSSSEAEIIASQHLWEDIDYYEKMQKANINESLIVINPDTILETRQEVKTTAQSLPKGLKVKVISFEPDFIAEAGDKYWGRLEVEVVGVAEDSDEDPEYWEVHPEQFAKIYPNEEHFLQDFKIVSEALTEASSSAEDLNIGRTKAELRRLFEDLLSRAEDVLFQVEDSGLGVASTTQELKQVIDVFNKLRNQFIVQSRANKEFAEALITEEKEYDYEKLAELFFKHIFQTPQSDIQTISKTYDVDGDVERTLEYSINNQNTYATALPIYEWQLNYNEEKFEFSLVIENNYKITYESSRGDLSTPDLTSVNVDLISRQVKSLFINGVTVVENSQSTNPQLISLLSASIDASGTSLNELFPVDYPAGL